MTPSISIQEFETQGYTIVRNVVPAHEIVRLRKVFDEMCLTLGGDKKKKSHDLMLTQALDDVTDLQSYLFTGEVKRVLSELLGPSIWCLPESLLHCNRYFDWHKDSTVMDLHAIDFHQKTESTIVQLGLYFQDNTPAGGGIYLTRGSHRIPDRFVLNENVHIVNRVLQHVMGCSLNQKIERNESPFAPDIKAGDVILFDYRLDHRASFIRNIWGKPQKQECTKYAVFSQFSANEKLLRSYLEAIRINPGPYADFLKTYRLSDSLRSLLHHAALNSILP